MLKDLRLTALLLSLFLSTNSLWAQHDDLSSNPYFQGRRIVGLNMTPLVTQLVPFNRSNPRDVGPYMARFKWYGPTGKSAFRMSVGIHLRTDGNFDLEDPQLNFAIGWEKRKNISRRWCLTKGFDFMFLGGDQNIPGNASLEPFFGLGPAWGIEFAADHRVTLGVEAALILGFVPDVGFQADFLPPVGIFLHYYFH